MSSTSDRSMTGSAFGSSSASRSTAAGVAEPDTVAAFVAVDFLAVDFLAVDLRAWAFVAGVSSTGSAASPAAGDFAAGDFFAGAARLAGVLLAGAAAVSFPDTSWTVAEAAGAFFAARLAGAPVEAGALATVSSGSLDSTATDLFGLTSRCLSLRRPGAH